MSSLAADEHDATAAGDAVERVHDLARQPVALRRRRERRLVERLEPAEDAVEAALERLAVAPAESVETSRAAEWLLDNHYIIRRAFRLVSEEFPADFERHLPCFREGTLAGLPRAYAVAREIATSGAGHLDLQASLALLGELQGITPLTLAETWALPTLLRMVVLERLTHVVDGIAPDHVDRRRADLTDEAITAVVAGCVRDLRVLETADWKRFVEDVSVVEEILRGDPAGVYAQMDFETRDAYRKAVEDVAAGCGASEPEVAEAVVQQALVHGEGRGRHVGFYLIGDGARQLESHLGTRRPWGFRCRRWVSRRATPVYIGSAVLLTAFWAGAIAALVAVSGGSAALVAIAGLLALLPASAIAVGAMNSLVTRILPPRVLPKLDDERGLPPRCRTLVAVPALLTRAEEIDTLVRDLEIRFLANPDPQLGFALLTDLGDAAVPEEPADPALIDRAAAAIAALNQRHGDGEGGGPFHLLHRPRRWSASERCWMGWERKRGKLAELNRLLLGGDDAFSLHVGDPDGLRDIRFVIALDADTELPRGAASRLVATLAHPLNSAEVDADGSVRAGYTVLQPRVEISPLSATTRFARLFSSGSGLDPYTLAVSDVYQDLFGEGVFAGKGIYDVAAFERSLEGRVPEEALLSHDLFEGVHGRAGLVTDVVFIEDLPDHYLAFTRRMHRWTRGDWQLLPWLGRQVPLLAGSGPNRLTRISRWKIFDNLRRSVVPPGLLAFLVSAWLWFPGSPFLWVAFALLVPATPPLIDLIAAIGSAVASPSRFARGEGLRPALRGLAVSCGFEITFLAHQAFVLLDAIGRTLWRLRVSRVRLLEWRAAAHTARRLAGTHSHTLVWREMVAAPLFALAVLALVVVLRPSALLAAVPLLALWLVSPAIAEWMSRKPVREQAELTAVEVRELRRVARRTWAFFETFGGPEDQWLPPDHFQQEPRGTVARRTSPTNIGLLLLASLAACDLGYRGILWVTLRLKNVFDTLERMERYRGHLLNWYATSTLEPLLPRYVSAVDSGNFVACLITLREGCVELRGRPALEPRAWQGFLDTLDVLGGAVARVEGSIGGRHGGLLEHHLGEARRRVEEMSNDPVERSAALRWLVQEWSVELDRRFVDLLGESSQGLDPAVLADLRQWSGEVRRHLQRMQREAELMAPWSEALANTPALFSAADLDAEAAATWARIGLLRPANPSVEGLPDLCAEAVEDLKDLDARIAAAHAQHAGLHQAREWIAKLAQGLLAAQQTAQYILERLDELRDRADRFIRETDFALLYDRRRRLLYIGYDVGAGKLDEHHYDLLASEARIASLVAIAKGDVPEEHWLHLGRPIGNAGDDRMLLSWSGTMFEYLMPPLILREGEETLIGRSCRAAVAEQIAYARKRGIPWGISESGYSRVDAQQNYQYRAFGVPRLGFRREVREDLVVAPYASLLALPFAPKATLENLRTLTELGVAGPYGFYEAVDFTWSRLPPGRRYTVVRSFMAHHQGMILASLDNFLNDAPLVRRFHAAPMVRTVELLLFERPPASAPIEQAQPPSAGGRAVSRRRIPLEPWRAAADADAPQVHLLSNGRYSLMLTDSGGGWSRWNNIALTRWTPDATRDEDGFRIYVTDARRRPNRQLGGSGTPREVVFHPHMAEIYARNDDISVRETIAIASDSDVEIRLLRLTNEGESRRTLSVTGYGEVVLQEAAADRRHPAFSKMFVESEALPELGAVLFKRRQRERREQPLFLLHMLVLPPTGAKRLGHETSREVFLGRGGSVRAPAALAQGAPNLSGRTGATLDPAMALGAELELAPHRSRQLAFVTIVAETRAAALALAASSRSLGELEWAFDVARERSEEELTRLNLDGAALHTAESLLALLLYSHGAMRSAADVLERNTLGRSALWRFSVSGDLPILLVRLATAENATFLLEVLRAQSYWRGRGVAVDVVILNERATSYSAEVADRIGRAVAAAGAEGWLQRAGGVFLIHADQLAEAERALLLSAAGAVVDAGAGALAAQVARPMRPAPLPPLVPIAAEMPAPRRLERPRDLRFDNGLGGFSSDGREYIIHLEPGEKTPAPWSNVIANPSFGFLVSESGSGYSWSGNSGENRLTPWRNDPVSDPPSEALYLRDEETGAVWSPTPLPAPAAGAHQIRHGAGYTEFVHHSHDLQQRLRLFVPVADPIKLIELEIANTSERPRRITATYYAEWLLGVVRDGFEAHVVPSFDSESEALLARNPWNEDFSTRTAFLAASEKLHGFTGDRTEFLGRWGSWERPAALARVGLASAVRPGADPCAALQVHLDLGVGETRKLHFLLGQGEGRDDALRLVREYRAAEKVEAAWREVNEHWDRLLGAVEVRTPDPAFDLMVNRWLLYQSLSSRVWGRTGFYQSSGAFGFRDQLQDVAALLHSAPELARAHLLESARHQFEEGDVLHWWHPPGGAGIRSRCSDDLLWLPFITAHYVAATGDRAVLDEEIAFLVGEPLRPTEVERYGRFAESENPGTLLEHCLRALRQSRQIGAHGLPLFGSGDWNDGMSRVGILGRGESVWLGWFRYATLIAMADLCARHGRADAAQDQYREAESLRAALEASAWDGEWYMRGTYDDGSRLGSVTRDECRIDAVAQSWAVLSEAAPRDRQVAAMSAVRRHLVRDGLVLLFAPAFDKGAQDPGYVAGYPPGIRENGGQYTHAAVWTVWALLRLGETELAAELFRGLLPIAHSADTAAAQRYRVEPYAVAADIYSIAPWNGRGGWTWYTGSAAWLHRLALEGILGLRLVNGAWHLDPHLPPSWPGFEMTLRYGASVYEVGVDNAQGAGSGIAAVSLDGKVLRDAVVARIDDGGTHRIDIVLGSEPTRRAAAKGV